MSDSVNKKTKELYQAVLKLKNQDEAVRFFRDLLTEPEIIEFNNRWRAAQMLDQGLPYSLITKKTGLSSTTIARISKSLKTGKGGYKLIISRMKKT
ncbi:MAG: YerC/YecD family TrpR-related protein [bacterium]